MNFAPTSSGHLNESLIGIAIDPIKTLFRPTSDDVIYKKNDDSLYGRERIDRSANNSNNEFIKTILFTIITALVFVTIISIFDVFRNIINKYYANKTLNEVISDKNREDILRSKNANHATLMSSIYFSLFCIIISLIGITIIKQFIPK